MDKIHEITEVHFDGNSMILALDGRQQSFDLNIVSPVLMNASQQERIQFEISPSGYGIHWPLIDEDLSIDGLLGIQHTLPSKQKVG